MTKPSKRAFKAPAHLTQHRAAARRSSPPHDHAHDGPSATGRAPRHGAGIRPPEGRHVPSAHHIPYTSAIGARLVSFVVRRRRQLVVSGARTAIRVTTAVSSLLKPRLLVGEILKNSEDHYSTPTKPLNCALFPKLGWRSGMLRTWHSPPVRCAR